MGHCILTCTKGESQCCICCTKREECSTECDDMDSYEYTEDCPNYVKEEIKSLDRSDD